MAVGCQPHTPAAVNPRNILVLISVNKLIDSRVKLRLKVVSQLRNPIASSGIQPGTFRQVA
jgi:hypothetical protein